MRCWTQKGLEMFNLMWRNESGYNDKDALLVFTRFGIMLPTFYVGVLGGRMVYWYKHDRK